MSVDPSLDYMRANELQHLRSLLTAVKGRTPIEDTQARGALDLALDDVTARIEVFVNAEAALPAAAEAARETAVNAVPASPTSS
jgi:hypothetical protein